MIQLRCPKCHAVLKVNDFAADGMGSCPNCGQGLQLPVRNVATAPRLQIPVWSVAPDPSVKELAAERLPRRALLIAGLTLVLLLVLGLSWFSFSPDTPSAVLVSTIMNANARNYS